MSRLARYVAAELAIVAAALVGAGFATERLASAIAEHWHQHADRLRAEGFARSPRGEDNPELAIADEPRATFLGMDDDMLLERVRRQPITKVKLNKGGSSLSFRVDFADGSRAAFKPAQTNLQTIPRKEVAAYRINRLLGLSSVAPAAPRMVSRDELFQHLHSETMPFLPRIRAETLFNPVGETAGVVMYWIPEIKDSGLDTPEGIAMTAQWLAQGYPLPPLDKRTLAAQVSNLIVFDFLISNPDRYSGGNMKMSPDGSQLFFMDNTMGFFLDPMGHEKPRVVLLRTQRFSKRLYRALDRLTMPMLERVLGDEKDTPYEILTAPEMRAVVARREFVKKHITGLIALYGEANVLVFP